MPNEKVTNGQMKTSQIAKSGVKTKNLVNSSYLNLNHLIQCFIILTESEKFTITGEL